MGSNDAAEMLVVAQAECLRLERELAAAQADLVWVRTWAERAGGVTDDEMDELRSYVSASPTDALDAAIRQAKAEAWGEGAKWAAVECGTIPSEMNVWLVSADNPYREGADRAE